MIYLIIKRALDFVIALFVFICALPIFLLVILVLWISNKKSDVFFFQARPGKNGKIFKVIKFKTMTDNKSASGELLPDEKRMTKIGSFIRRTSLDELPQLLNVISGNMSLVGPRPLLPEYLSLYNETQNRRHEVKPGITGWAQVNGRNAISWEKKFELDVWYVDHCSIALDVKIMAMTVHKIFKSEGINQAGRTTMEKFKGTKN